MNKAKLEYEMAVHGISKGAMCEHLGLSRAAFYRKCIGKTQFTLGEIKRVMEILNLDSPMEIFFDGKVS